MRRHREEALLTVVDRNSIADASSVVGEATLLTSDLLELLPCLAGLALHRPVTAADERSSRQGKSRHCDSR
jgi:hypothetical protein